MSQLFEEMMQGLGEAQAFLEGERKGFIAHVPESVDVKGLRSRLRMSQSEFSSAFGFSVDAVRHWEAHRRTPEASARAFLKVIEFNPQMVVTALAGEDRAMLSAASRPARKRAAVKPAAGKAARPRVAGAAIAR